MVEEGKKLQESFEQVQQKLMKEMLPAEKYLGFRFSSQVFGFCFEQKYMFLFDAFGEVFCFFWQEVGFDGFWNCCSGKKC